MKDCNDVRETMHDEKVSPGDCWSGQFGEEYTNRNHMSPTGVDILQRINVGITRTDQFKLFLSNLKINRILEVGCNIGNQLLILEEIGFKNLYGIEINRYAIDISKNKTISRLIDIIEGSAFDIPFKDGFFDLVFTSGLLIHIPPDDINGVLHEIYRCSKKYIMGMEYFDQKLTEVRYRKCDDMLWKRDFLDLYLQEFSDLYTIMEAKYPYLENKEHVDQVFLVGKK